ncbi:MAG: PaaI family thioesterase [Hyphomicrobiales bacterium]|nr:PaaI family thioesterase [Hyphomicrobiales bacterium]
MNLRQVIKKGGLAAACDLVPYAKVVGLECRETDDGLLTVLPFRETNIGNTQLPSIHGGVVGALLEHAAAMHLIWETQSERLPKIVNISIDYLRPCGPHDTFARAHVVKQGRAVANVRVEAWQKDPAKLVAAAHAHFLMG